MAPEEKELAKELAEDRRQAIAVADKLDRIKIRPSAWADEVNEILAEAARLIRELAE
jgi:hypothetical protein